MVNSAVAQQKKAEGNALFKAKNFAGAVQKYTEAIEADPNDHTFWSNRSACNAELGNWEQSAEDARECVNVNKTFVKGYFRWSLALQRLGRIDEALEAVKKGLQIDAVNADLKKKRTEIETAIRERQVEAALEAAQKQFSDGDLAGALRNIETGLRLAPGHSGLTSLESRVRPRWEAQEKARRSGLSPVERLKEEGDQKYKNAQFEEAIQIYSRCLDQITDKTTSLALKIFSNRSACHKQLSHFDGVIDDTTHVLEYEPNNVKCLIRRAQALEAVERYRLALQDVRGVLQMPLGEIGQQTFQLANGMQHRLTRVVQQLKESS